MTSGEFASEPCHSSGASHGVQVSPVMKNSFRSPMLGRALIIAVSVLLVGGLAAGASVWQHRASRPKDRATTVAPPAPAATPTPTPAATAPEPIPVPVSSLVV